MTRLERRHARGSVGAATVRFAVLLAALLPLGCSTGGDPVGPDVGRTDGDADVDFEVGGPCDPTADDCPAGSFCSALGRCVRDGTCLDARDCAAGQHCGLESFVCLGEGECRSTGDCGPGFVCDPAAGTCVIGGACGDDEFDTTRLAPNMMILLDRSGSMEGLMGSATRWDVAKEAVRQVTEAYDDEIRFGLATFSACLPGGCSPGTIVVPLADSNAAAVNGFLAPLAGRGSATGTPPDYLCDSGDPETSTGRSLLALVGEPALQDPARTNTVLLVTDGAETGECTDGGAHDGPAGAAALLGQTEPVQTYVVGFSRDVSADALTAVATAGGTERYYQADDASGLLAALSTIASHVASCDFRVDADVADPSLIHVYFNDDPTQIPPDPANGWTYDETTGRLSFHGTACDGILSGDVTDIDVVYDCDGPVLG